MTLNEFQTMAALVTALVFTVIAWWSTNRREYGVGVAFAIWALIFGIMATARAILEEISK